MNLRLLACALLAASMPASAAPAGALRPVAAVNGVELTVREVVEQQRALRFAFAEDEAGLRAAALAACVEWQVTLQLARDQGILADTDDRAVRTAFAAENEQRRGDRASGRPVFGPEQFTWPQFRRYWMDGIVRRLQEVVDRAAGEEHPDELRRFYRAHPALFTAPSQAAPEPFAELDGHVRRLFRRDRLARLVREAVAGAQVTVREPVFVLLTPRTPIE